MGNIDKDLLTNELMKQNPWRQGKNVWAEDPELAKRDFFAFLKDKIINNDLITAITGLRRVGKTTLLKQIINNLLSSGVNPQNILYFSFEETPLFQNSQLLAAIIDDQIQRSPKAKSYFFFDEIQYVDYWNAVLKKYFDPNLPAKFVVTGSSSLFIKTKARESLAGRILEYSLAPLSYGEYLRLIKKITLPKVSSFTYTNLLANEKVLRENFFDYLTFGEFPYLPKLQNFSDQKQYVLDWVVNKIVENDLPKLYHFKEPTQFSALADVLVGGSGQLVELQNLAADLAIQRKTLSQYLSLLEKSCLIKQVYNLGSGFRTRSFRQRKIYSSSVNAVVLQTTGGSLSESFILRQGQIAENFVAQYLSRQEGEKFIWRERGKEVDFIWLKDGEKIPIEVKFQNKIHSEDLKNLFSLGRKVKLNEAIVVTKEKRGEEVINGLKIRFIPAHFLVG